jgi:hypothetical protein
MKVGDVKARSVVTRPENSKTRRTKMPTLPKPLEQLLNYLSVTKYPPDRYKFGADSMT